MSLDDLFRDEDSAPTHGSRRRMAAQTFVVAVVAAGIGLVLLALVLYGLGAGAIALWNHWWDDFA